MCVKKMMAVSTVIVLACASSFTAPAKASDGFWRRSYEPQPIAHIDAAAIRFNSFDKLAEKNPGSLPDYMRSGIVLSDMACKQWLETLGRADRDTNFAKDTMNIVGNLILGISGINGANPSSLARGSLGLAAGNASIDAFKNEVILGALADIEAKLVEGRKITAATIRANIPTNYDDAKGMLLSYHEDCSPNAIKILLKNSLAAVKYQEADTSLNEAAAKVKEVKLLNELLADMYPGDTTKKLSDDELYKLYLAKIAPIGNPIPNFVTAMMTSKIKVLAADFSSKNAADREDKLKKLAELKGFATRYAEEWTLAKKASVEELARKEREAAKIAMGIAEAKNALRLKDVQKVESTPDAKAFFLAPNTTPINKALVDALKQSAEKVKWTNSKEAKELIEAVKKLEVKQDEIEIAKKQDAEIAAAPPPLVAAPDARKEVRSLVSVNAVLVPTGQTK